MKTTITTITRSVKEGKSKASRKKEGTYEADEVDAAIASLRDKGTAHFEVDNGAVVHTYKLDRKNYVVTSAPKPAKKKTSKTAKA